MKKREKKIKVSAIDELQPIYRNARQCGICGAPADRYHTMYQCQANPGHMADINTGILSDLSHITKVLKCAR